MPLLEIALNAAAVVVLMPATLVLVQVIAASLPRRVASSTPSGRRPPIAVLIPAHDEAAGIAQTIAALRPQLVRGDRIVVIADNCSDDTARTALAAGAEVFERTDPALRGKGYALAFAAPRLETDPPEVVVVVDADCTLSHGALDTLARACAQAQRPVQAHYRMQCHDGATRGMRIAQLAWILKNHVRPFGFQRLGLPCQLMGTGMALPWRVYRSAPLASGCLVEDVALGLHAARIGAPALFCPEAVVQSRFASSAEGQRTQRRRWEHGHLALLVGEAPRLFLQALAARNWNLLALVADLCVPPLALLGVLIAAVLCIALALGMLLPGLIAGAALASLLAAVAVTRTRFARNVISLGGLAYAAIYALGKIPLYAGFLARRQVEWVRADRTRAGVEK